jgi:hypothetical protein
MPVAIMKIDHEKSEKVRAELDEPSHNWEPDWEPLAPVTDRGVTENIAYKKVYVDV